VAVAEGRLAGVVMGHATGAPDWPEAIQAEWTDFVAGIPGLADRFAEYDAVEERAHPQGPVWHPDVIAVDPARQGEGIGRRLTERFIAGSDRDPASSGVCPEASNPSNLPLYRHIGFVERASGPVGEATLWAMFRPKGAAPGT
jgi:GNAT superfamily N-acetyltransferase